MPVESGNTKTKVALIHNIIAPYRVPLFEELSNNSHIDLNVFYCKKIHKIRKWDIKEGNYKYEILPGVSLEFGDFTNSFNPSILLRLIKGNFDVIIIGGWWDLTMQLAYVMSKIKKKPVILWSEGFTQSNTLSGKFIVPIVKYIIRNSDAIIVPGTSSKRFHTKMGSSPEKIFIAPNIVNNQFYIKNNSLLKSQKEELKGKFNLENKKVILYVGRLIEQKGIDTLLSAYKKLQSDYNNIGLVIVGDGIFKKNLSEFCRKEKINNVYFTGYLGDEEKIIFYSISDVFVFPTLRDVWGLVVNEAMCCSLPVICSSAAGCNIDMIKNGENGFIVEPGNIYQIYISIKDILQSDERQYRMGKKSLEIIEKEFTIERAIAGFIEAIKFAQKSKKIILD